MALPQRQPSAHSERIAASAVQPDTFTQPQLAALRQQLQSLQHLGTLAGQVRRSTQSHGMTMLDASTDGIRRACAAGVEAIYRAAAEAPDSPLDHVRQDKQALVLECEQALGLQGRAAA